MHTFAADAIKTEHYYCLVRNLKMLYQIQADPSGAARSKAWVCGRSFAGIAGLNPASGKEICLL
jgi:hypothetical protein